MPSPKFQPSEVGSATLHMAWANANAVAEVVSLYSFETLTRVTLPSANADVAIDDWDELLSAVKTRLRQTVGEQAAAAPQPVVRDAAGQVQSSVRATWPCTTA